jgi:hypothetical protein
MTRPVEYRHGCDTNAPDVRIFHGASREDAKHAKSGDIGRCFSLRPWRLGAMNFVEVVLLNISKVRD